MTMTTNDLAAIRARAEKATPGPWAWHGNERNHDVYLTQEYGQTVMKFRRWGMQNAQPVFTVNHFLKPASELLQADHNGVIWSIHHPDAAFIAAARSDVPKLLDELEEAREVNSILWLALRDIAHHDGLDAEEQQSTAKQALHDARAYLADAGRGEAE